MRNRSYFTSIAHTNSNNNSLSFVTGLKLVVVTFGRVVVVVITDNSGDVEIPGPDSEATEVLLLKLGTTEGSELVTEVEMGTECTTELE